MDGALLRQRLNQGLYTFSLFLKQPINICYVILLLIKVIQRYNRKPKVN